MFNVAGASSALSVAYPQIFTPADVQQLARGGVVPAETIAAYRRALLTLGGWRSTTPGSLSSLSTGLAQRAASDVAKAMGLQTVPAGLASKIAAPLLTTSSNVERAPSGFDIEAAAQQAYRSGAMSPGISAADRATAVHQSLVENGAAGAPPAQLGQFAQLVATTAATAAAGAPSTNASASQSRFQFVLSDVAQQIKPAIAAAGQLPAPSIARLVFPPRPTFKIPALVIPPLSSPGAVKSAPAAAAPMSTGAKVAIGAGVLALGGLVAALVLR